MAVKMWQAAARGYKRKNLKMRRREPNSMRWLMASQQRGQSIPASGWVQPSHTSGWLGTEDTLGVCLSGEQSCSSLVFACVYLAHRASAHDRSSPKRLQGEREGYKLLRSLCGLYFYHMWISRFCGFGFFCCFKSASERLKRRKASLKLRNTLMEKYWKCKLKEPRGRE